MGVPMKPFQRYRASSFSRATVVSTPGSGQSQSQPLGQGRDSSPRYSPSNPDLEQSRLIKDTKGRFMFIGDSANLSFLQVIRKVIGECEGSCQFVDDPLRYQMVEASPEGRSTWMDVTSEHLSPSLTLHEAEYLIRRYSLTTGCVCDMFDESELLRHLGEWMSGEPVAHTSIPSPIHYLVCAIGAQTCPEDKDDLAQSLFSYGRYLTTKTYTEDVSILTVQSYALITMYLLGASRRNAAFMNLGIAVRAAYALGLHLKDIASSFSASEFVTRERLWKVLRILDLFMSASLGRPPSTSETRDTQCPDNYSCSNDLCAVFEKILTDVYSKRSISTRVLAEVGSHHRRWASRFTDGLETDRIQPREYLSGTQTLNIGLIHVKEAYYWTIMLVTRPFFTESIVTHARLVKAGLKAKVEPCTMTDSFKVLVHACVDSAIRTMILLKPFLSQEAVPKRLPFVNNSIFMSALVLSFAYFGDLYQIFPLEQNLQLAHTLLALFPEDAIACRNATIVSFLQDACKIYHEKRNHHSMELQGEAIHGLFGQIHQSSGPRVGVPASQDAGGNGIAPDPASSVSSTIVMQTGSQTHGFGVDAISPPTNGLPDDEDHGQDGTERLAGLDDFDFYQVMSPRTLWFDSYNDMAPLFSTVDATIADLTTPPGWNIC